MHKFIFGAMMTLTSADEFRHEPGPQSRWQETYWFVAWDSDRRCGLDIHLAHQPHEGYVETQIAAIFPEQIISLGGRYACDDALAIPGLDVDVHTPFENWTLRYAGTGVRGPNEGGIYAQGPGDIPFGFFLEFHHPLPINDVSSQFRRVGRDITNNNYSGGAVFAGELWCAQDRIPISGLIVRDHSWGVRDLTFDLVIGGFFALDEANTFIYPASVLTGDQWAGLCIVQDKNGSRDHGDPFIRLDGIPVLDGFRNSTTRIPDEPKILNITGQTPLPRILPSYNSGPNYIEDHVMSTAHWGDKTGSGVTWALYPSTSPLAANLPPDCGQQGPLPIIDT